MDNKNKQVQARVTEEEYKKIIKLAKQSNCKSLSEYLADKTLNAEAIEFDLKDINEHLLKVGNDLNHLVLLCHQERIKSLDMTKFVEEIELLR